ncbi:MiaB/RimO family radical SAM methylthiotransferase [Lachnoanaerobaculum umeaense]|uniref:Threonylcarbamoyladenosine tRNA methylthiotransferase MtaB n=1 Tax=Lachnoanaerobaculum umeaense TaxID=617123 RepID=A0A385Q677_9FIRM|nr:MiaB/RimO family radical SAM methylthiotransferase [Lachnoanaerobaculum umeaense]AYB00784.1 MiaB/RimO family radical SAM methylthiotransferase [Lachnoanaerobaculum umeaense]PZW94984.1 threonylcarbamoyladenosine tRNA methylthiotransferase MtaB [Lachnoanaerobaculum umeaense]
MKTVAFHTLGCKVNTYETEAMQQLMEAAGYSCVEFGERADVYIINTCSVTNIADRKSRQMLHRARKMNEDAIVVAAGCYVESAKDKIDEDLSIDIIVGNNNKNDIVNIINEYLQNKKENKFIIDINKEIEYEEFSISKINDHTRAFIKVQDGCNQFCSYCIIPFTRGRVRSRKMENILDEVKNLASYGYKEIVLTGIHLSSYGVDFLDESYNKRMEKLTQTEESDEEFVNKNELLCLIENIADIAGIERIRIGSLEPRIIKENFIKRLSVIDKFCPHFHLSLQSGCDKTLKNMNRKYTAYEFYEGVELIRKYFNSPAITTDIIVGFPGESESDFEESRKFIEKVKFYETHIFPYSIREGTKAAKMSQIDGNEKVKRANILNEININNQKEFRDLRLGKEDEMLCEELLIKDGIEYFTGYTKEYVKVAFLNRGFKTNDIIKGKIVDFLTDDILLMK